MKKTIFSISALALFGLFTSCNDDDKGTASTQKDMAVQNYAGIVYLNYQDALTDAQELEAAINAFTANPTDAAFTTAKDKWKEARESYGTTEAFRFANGPIDNSEDAPEGLLNSWPLDENYIDYVDNNGTPLYGGIINNTDVYPTITKELLEGLNGEGGEKNVSVGYHAIEFLLWGQDLTAPSALMPGQRPYTDYTTAQNADRRKQYLNICADLLTDHLSYLVDQWAPSGGAYRSQFLAMDADEALQNIYLGIATLALAELPVERMAVALSNADQEDEHSCFSDNTHRDIALNLQGIINVYKGTYGNVSGVSLEDLVQDANPEFAASTSTSLNSAVTKVAAMYTPFDFAISGGESSAEGAKVKAAYQQIQDFGQNLLAGAAALGLTVDPQ